MAKPGTVFFHFVGAWPGEAGVVVVLTIVCHVELVPVSFNVELNLTLNLNRTNDTFCALQLSIACSQHGGYYENLH